MEALVLIIAALILAAGIALWRADSHRRASSADPVPGPPESVADGVEPPALRTDATVEQSGAVYEDPAEELDVEAEAELIEVPNVREAEIEVGEVEVEAESEADTEPAQEETPTEKGSFLHSLRGGQRRERKHWATRHGFDFIREDAFLNDEWTRGAAAAGAAARDVVSGMAVGYETHLVDLAGVPVMAMRRGPASDVVVDLRRGGESVEESEDLLEVGEVSGFRLLSNDAGVAGRLVDERVRAALDAMPEAVTAVWMESDWVLAETVRSSTAEAWDAMIEPLALLVDSSFTLPPRNGTARRLDLALIEPTRIQPPAPERTPDRPAPHEEDLTQPLVIRPDSRTHPESRGVVEPRELGADDVDSIADGTPSRPDDYNGTRIIRDLNGGSRIFEDSSTPPEIQEPES
ncbi:hypothetical protein [Corynebacterium pacaense]|uniref:hypothetical protein n=1 Tax=Corynebacterium pacaense TaxID=1816684 RepID=UPI0009BAE426|nr:hypothetical protein [Corynebacterium pacaense]